MGQLLPDRLFWAREEKAAAPGDERVDALADAPIERRRDAPGTH